MLDLYSLLDPEVLANPYPLYQRLRAEAAPIWSEEHRGWMVSRYADVVEVALDPRFSSAVFPPPDKVEPEQRRTIEILSELLFVIEPPDHTRMRGLLNKAFTPCIGGGLREHIQQIADSLLDAVQESGRMDIIRDLAIPLPLTVITELLGLPLEDRPQFKQWIADFNGLFGDRHITPEEGQKMSQSLVATNDYFYGLIEQRRREPKHDLISRLALAEEQGGQLSPHELLTVTTVVFLASQKTTTDLIGNGLLALLQKPDQMQKLQDEPTLLECAVEELLRYESPKQWVARRAIEDIELYGAKICKDQWVLLMLGAANRDPARFPDPDRLDITRTDNRHLAFGYGPHMCAASHLARMNGQIAISTILRRMPGLSLETDSLEWNDNPFFRSLKSLPVTF